MTTHPFSLSLPVLLLGLLATGASAAAPDPRVDEPRRAGVAPAPTDFEKDRQAILAMLGEYEVRFGFEETVALKAGYARREPKHTGAHEVVVLVEDSGRKIGLQHLLVSESGDQVIKHWRQDWTYQASTRFEFIEDQTWRVKAIPAEITKDAWTQWRVGRHNGKI